MKNSLKVVVGLGLSALLVGCNSQPIIDGAIQGALGQVAQTVGVSTGATRSGSGSDFLSPAHSRNECRYFNENKCAQDFGTLSVTTERNRNNVTLVRYGRLVEGASGGQLKESSVSEQMFPYLDQQLIDFDTNIYVDASAKSVRPGTYYFKGQYGSQNPALAVGTIVLKPGVTNIIHVTYN